MFGVVKHVANGDACFFGGLLLLLLVVARRRSTRGWRRLGIVVLCLGLISVVISSTPIPYVVLGVGGLSLMGWLCVPSSHRFSRWLTGLWVVVILTGLWAESSYRRLPQLLPVDNRKLTIIGDSLTAGLPGNDWTIRWPVLLSERHQLDVQEIAQAGASTAKAYELVQERHIESHIVVIEIGGNDLLGGRPADAFSHRLGQLLAAVCQEGRQVLMVELPLPPLSHGYSRAQRSLAAKYGVQLIPKNILMEVLSHEGATTDGLHLSTSGHEHLAQVLWEILEPAYGSTQDNAGTRKRSKAASTGLPETVVMNVGIPEGSIR